MFFISIFYICFEIAGAEFPSKDYSNMPPEFMSWMDIFRNSIGDIQSPKYSFWIDFIDEHTSAYVMIALIWIVWVGELFFVLIILLNFLIAIISQSYEAVMMQQNMNKYRHRSQLNRECRMTMSFLRWDTTLGPFVLATNVSDSQGDGEWYGFIHTIKRYVYNELHHIKLKVRSLDQRINGLIY